MTRKKSKKKIGEYGEAVISKFPDAVNALRRRYKQDFPDITLFLNFNALDKNFIFQRFNSYPLKQITVKIDTKSILFHASWRADGALDYLLPKSYFEIEAKKSGDKVDWGDVSGFGSKTNFYERAALRAGAWTDIDEINNIQASVDIRIDNIKSINMYEWGFEVIGSIISMLAVKKGEKCPRLPQKISMNSSDLTFNFDVIDDIFVARWSEPGYSPVRKKMSDFDKILFGTNEEEVVENKVRNLGQRCMKKIILED